MSSVLSSSDDEEELSYSNLWMFTDYVCSSTDVVLERMLLGEMLWMRRISSIFERRFVWLRDLFDIWSEFKFVVFWVEKA